MGRTDFGLPGLLAVKLGYVLSGRAGVTRLR